MRRVKMQILVDLAKKGASDLAAAVRESLIPVGGVLVVWCDALERALLTKGGTPDGVKVRRTYGARSVTAEVFITNPEGEVVWARGQSQCRAPTLPPVGDPDLKIVEDEALLQAVEACLREEAARERASAAEKG